MTKHNMRKLILAAFAVLSLSCLQGCNLLVKNIYECRIDACNMTEQDVIVRHTAVQESGTVVTTITVEALTLNRIDLFEPLTGNGEFSEEEEKAYYDKNLTGLEPDSVVLEILDTDMNPIVSLSGSEAYSFSPDGPWEETLSMGMMKEKTGKTTQTSIHSKSLHITTAFLSGEKP